MSSYTIDSLIEKYKIKAENSRRSINRMDYYNKKEYEAIVKYLEELKGYKNKDINK